MEHVMQKAIAAPHDENKSISSQSFAAMGASEEAKLMNGRPSSVTIPCPSPHNGKTARVLDLLEKAIVWALNSRPRKPLHYLSGNYAPVEETSPHSGLRVLGKLPSCLNGEFVRIGPNPMYKPVAGYHWFDGDGMIHGVRIKDGKATYVSRFVQTSRLKQEKLFGESKFVKIGDMKGIFGLLTLQLFSLRSNLKVLDRDQGLGTGNTAMVYHDGRLLALHEVDKPYVIRVLEDGDLQTMGFMDYEKRLTHPFTAHPKVDPVTGELFTFGYQLEAPYCTYRVISRDGIMQDPVTITISGPVMMHDFAITENYAIFMDMPLYFQPKEMVKGSLVFRFDHSKKARFGILPRYAKSEAGIKWFELPTCYAFHNVNAWEEEDEIVLYTCRLPELDLEILSGELKDNCKEFETQLYEMRFNMRTGTAMQKQMSLSTVDFPKVNENYIGRKQQFAYCTMLEHTAKMKGLVKFDLWAKPQLGGKTQIEVGGNVKGVIEFGYKKYGSEASFVPRDPNEIQSEDDGYLICFVHDEGIGKSEVVVYDAKTMASEPVAVVKMPSRVPYGLHALFVSEDKLCAQK